MGLDMVNQIDALGVDHGTGEIVLSILDSWAWGDERGHLLALQAKLNAYFAFIESGEIFNACPDARGRRLVIDVIWRAEPLASGLALLGAAQDAAGELGVRIGNRVVEEP